MSKETLKPYVVIARYAELASGLIRISAAQAADRLHCLTPIEVDTKTGSGIYQLKSPTQFKAGEQFEYDDVMPKATADYVVTPEQADALKKAEAKTAGKKTATR